MRHCFMLITTVGLLLFDGGCSPSHPQSAATLQGTLHIGIFMEGAPNVSDEPRTNLLPLRIVIDGKTVMDGQVYATHSWPAEFWFPVSGVKSHVTIEVSNEAKCSFDVEGPEERWAYIRFYWGRENWEGKPIIPPKPLITCEVAKEPIHPF